MHIFLQFLSCSILQVWRLRNSKTPSMADVSLALCAWELWKTMDGTQMMVWWIVPDMIAQGLNSPKIMYYFLFTSLLQYIPRIFHTLHASRRMENVIGFVFGTAWWAFLINLTYYFLAAHVSSLTTLE